MRTLAIVVMCAGCSGGGGSTDVKPTLKLADRSDAELARLIGAAGGADMFQAQAEVDQYGGSTDPCPAIAIAGDTATLSGGCTTTDGIQLQGTASATNSVAWDPQITYRYNADTSYAFVDFALVESGQSLTYDGTMRVTDMMTTWDADVTTTMLGVSVRSDIYYHCDRTGAQSVACELSGSGLELIGVGGVLASGNVDTDASTGKTTATYTLRGIDTLTATITNGCVAWQISGTTRAKACP
jgi:hypothetical protein